MSRLALLTLVLVAVRIGSAFVVAQPGYTDAYYYADVASRFARGLGLTADFVWSPIELGALPVVSHRFWMPLATVLQGAVSPRWERCSATFARRRRRS